MKNSVLFGLVFLIALCGFTASATSQSKMKKAEAYYNSYQYATAAKMYKKAAKGKKKEDALVHLADCYRQMKMFKEAELTYAKLVNLKTSVPMVYYYYGEVLLNNKKYQEANKQLKTYLSMSPADPKGKLLLRASDEMQTWQVQTAAYKVYPLYDLNTPFSEFSPVVYNG